ncbi:hypothetical protein [Dyadobacter sandarakinus]|uniref:Uncharacterized protein n=1 Tax=Dyadobacter sandarakinus TaxID=2747268 RepID=A0ABX7I2K8_9BACT|nr:hypothetical protein [Dyadobacter sandarakinus]QRQ99756.1 hypothetical protein HWI92_01890 [Dyadobacter sandarakinus]
MLTSEQEDLLARTHTSVLKEVAEDAEKLLVNFHQSEQQINSKSVGMIQILLPLIIALAGYSISEFLKNGYRVLPMISAIMGIVLLASCGYFVTTLNLYSVSLVGGKPFDSLDEYLADDNELDAKNQFQRNRIHSLHQAIVNTEISNLARTSYFRKAYQVLLYGTILTAFILIGILIASWDAC